MVATKMMNKIEEAIFKETNRVVVVVFENLGIYLQLWFKI